ncbi:WD repeat-containing protein on Y chromosome-like [Osmerus mordax]|uniref:WD repeat-containing protein on Y chromosome-like n=1 Tax=Osmerus mordax TaxID=8014 RepID=UPI00350FBF16
MFHEADIEGEGGLSMNEFRIAIKEIMGDVNDEDLDNIFMKVDTNCDGSVDWEEYLNYMLLEYREKDSLQKQNRPLYFPKPLKIIPVSHCEPIVSLQFYPFQTQQADNKDAGGQDEAKPKTRTQLGRYLSISRDGILNYWSERFKLTRTVNISHMKKGHTPSQKIWVNDMLCLSNLHLLAVATTGRDVDFFDISASKCDSAFCLTGLEGYIVVMDYWSDGVKSVFCLGDVEGCLTAFISSNVLQNGLFNSGAYKAGGSCRIPVPALLKNQSKYFMCFKVAILNNWCHQIRFLPDLNAIATCCLSDQTAMVLTTVPHSQKAKVYNSAFQIRKGILCFDYSPEFNILVTGGFDRTVRIWNPYINNCSISQMKGHSAAITHIVVNGSDNKIISISKDKNVRVWDLQGCTCLQSIHSRNVPMSRLPISSIHYNRDTNILVLATSLIGVLHGAVEHVDTSQKLKTSHEHSLCTALYNKNFKLVVSGCHNGVVSVWDILTGEKVMQFQTSPERPAEVTAMAFDAPKRRLITGSKDGTVRLWNFNNGALLLTLPMLDDNEVTGIIYINQRIYVSGWSKRVMWYLDVKEDMEMEYRVWNQYHSEDIYSMHAHGNKMLVTASYSGDIIIWNIDSGRAFCRFNASESPRPLLPKRVSPLISESITVEAELDAKDKTQKRLLGEHKADRSGKLPPISVEDLEKPSLAVEQALFLGTRERSPDTAILLTSVADGHVYAWSIHHQGGLLGKFRAVHSNGLSINSMSTDQRNQMLLTGDSCGYITLWDIEDYCLSRRAEQDRAGRHNPTTTRLPSLIPHYCKVEGPRQRVLEETTEETTEEVEDGWKVCLTSPPLLSTWRGHLRSIVSIEYVERFSVIVTASLDCNLRLWTISGSYIGTFGQAQWRLGDPHALTTGLPVDLRRVGSCQTLKVLNKGTRPHWNCARRILDNLTLQKLQNSANFSGSEAPKLQELVTSDPRITQYSSEQIEETWQRWQEKGKQTSAILGSAYKQKVRHHLPSCPPNLPVSFSSREQLRVFKLMPCCPLMPIIQPPVPARLKEQLKTQEAGDLLAKQKRNSKRGPHARYTAAKAGCKKSVASKQPVKGSLV